MIAPRLTTRQLNRTLLARQLLLDRVDLPIPDALERLCGIQNQNAPNAYVRLWSCLTGFRRDDLTVAYESGAAVQGTMMRGTIHTVSATDYHPMLAAIREPMHVWARRVHRGSDDSHRAAVVDHVRAAIAGRTIQRRDFLELIAEADRAVQQTIDTDAEVLRMPPSGTWAKRRADIFGLADDVVPHVELDVEEARRHIVRRYLGGFGPASADSIATFTGIPRSTLTPTLEAMGLRSYADEAGTTLLDLPDAQIMPPDVPAPVRFLPSWDSILLVHARRTAVLAEHHRPLLFHVHVGQSPPTFMIDGAVAGKWHWDAKEARVVMEPFDPLPARAMAALEEEAAGLAEFHR